MNTRLQPHTLAEQAVTNVTQRAISYSELQRHTSEDSCWVLIDGHVYDVTNILDSHPGGKEAILKNAGKDASGVFKPIHPPGTLNSLPRSAHLGPIDLTTIPMVTQETTEEQIRIAAARANLPHPEMALNLNDIVKYAEQVLTTTAWGYYRSAGDDNQSFYENSESFKRFWFRPRVKRLKKVSRVFTASSMLGIPCSLPIFISPAALARLGHPDGEVNLVRVAGEEGIGMGVSINASCSIDEIQSARNSPDQALFFQLYMDRNRSASEELVKRIERDGFRALILTVDSACAGNRELDRRSKRDFSGPAHGKFMSGTNAGVAGSISGYQDPDVCWDDIPWLQRLTKLPIVIKGIQCVEDAVKAFSYNVQAIIISNHGGRSLDFAPAPMTVLYELAQTCPDIVREKEVYIDGGVTRGTDVLKALCLGARGVGLGRVFLYANGVWGQGGVRRVIQIMREEIERGMRLMGVTHLEQLNSSFIRFGHGTLEPHL